MEHSYKKLWFSKKNYGRFPCNNIIDIFAEYTLSHCGRVLQNVNVLLEQSVNYNVLCVFI